MTGCIIGKIVLERYCIESIIHEGSMSIVYQAVDVYDNLKVVIKKCSLKDSMSICALKNEYKILNNLHYKGIPGVYNYISDSGYDYLIMEYIEGHTLESILINQSVNIQDILSIMEELCRILIYLHNHRYKVYHCDIKPSNIIISNKGQVFLIDYGVSVYDNNSIGQCFGTQGYAAPEQFDICQSVDARTDIYSLGVLIDSMLKCCGNTRYTSMLKKITGRCSHEAVCCRYSDVSEILTEIMYMTGMDGTVKILYA